MTRRSQRRAVAAWTTRTRETSVDAARALAISIVQGRSPGIQAYDLGIVLNSDEIAWQRVPACYQYRGERSWVVQHNSFRGRRSTRNEVRQSCMFDAGLLDWLITDQRIAARRADGTVLSIYWSAIEAVTVDLARECVVFDASDGFHGELSGPAIAPIAVAAIASCHGSHALLDHPGLEPLRVHFGAANTPVTASVVMPTPGDPRLPECDSRDTGRASSRSGAPTATPG